MDKKKEFIREIKINQKRRFKYNLITLVIFNILLLLSLVYMTALLKRKISVIIAVILFVLSIVGSVRTLIKTKSNRKYVLYRDKINIFSTALDAEIDLSKVFMVKAKRNIFDIIFRNDAHTIYIYVKNEGKDFYMLPFIGEDANLLVDEILKLAIEARENNKHLVLKIAEKNVQKENLEQNNLIKKKLKNVKKSTKNGKNM